MTVYWHVPEGSQQVQGTTEKEEASLFYIIKSDSSRHLHEFYIGYVGNELSALELPKGPANPMSKSTAALAPIPQYITADLRMVGSSDQPLGVTAGTHKNRARFTLHSSAVRKYAFTRTPVDSDKWAEGGGYFINCSRRTFKLDGYVAMERGERGGGGGGDGHEMQVTRFGAGRQRGGGAGGGASMDSHTYTTRCFTSMKNHRNNWPWMVFHLLPGEHKDASLEGHELRSEELWEPLIDRSKHPIAYQSDERDFQLLFGNPTAEQQTHNSS